MDSLLNSIDLWKFQEQHLVDNLKFFICSSFICHRLSYSLSSSSNQIKILFRPELWHLYNDHFSCQVGRYWMLLLSDANSNWWKQRQTVQDSALINVFQPMLSLLTILEVILRTFWVAFGLPLKLKWGQRKRKKKNQHDFSSKWDQPWKNIFFRSSNKHRSV